VAARRIGLLGGECSGKSTLAEDLALGFPACVVSERLRDFVDTMGRNPHEHEQLGIMLEQQAAEDALAARCPHGLVIADSAPLMIAVYSVAYFNDSSLIGPAVELARGYDLMLWCDTDLPWLPDGIQRDGAEYRELEDQIIGQIIRTHLVASGVEIVRVSGSREVRAQAAGRAWQLLAPYTPT
jgi:nicotinamide riboside kinase